MLNINSDHSSYVTSRRKYGQKDEGEKKKNGLGDEAKDISQIMITRFGKEDEATGFI